MINKLFRHQLQIVILGMSVIFVYFLSSYGRVTINLDTNALTTYQLESSAVSSSKKFSNTNSKSITKLLKRGSYIFLAKSSGKSNFSAFEVSGFFKNTRVTAEFSSEKNREYVGYNPEGCAVYANAVLYSYACVPVTTITTHVPATNDTPTYNQNVGTTAGQIMGSIHTKEGVFLFGKQPTSEAGENYSYVAYNISGGFDLDAAPKTDLVDLEKGRAYSFVAYQDGFMAYESNGASLYYYQKIDKKPVKIDSPSLNNASLRVVGASSVGQSFMIAYSNSSSQNDQIEINGYSDSGDKAAARQNKNIGVRPSTRIVIFRNGATYEYSFGSYFNSFALCGTNKLCLLDNTPNKNLVVYDIAGKTAKKIYMVTRTTDMKSIGSGLLLVRDGGVFSYDADSRSGFIELGFNLSRYCGLYDEGANYIVCLSDSRSNSGMLLIDRQKDVTGKIDLVVDEILGMPQVKNISVYKNKVFINLNTGEEIYDENLRSFVFDPVKQKQSLGVVNKRIVELGVDTKSYDIIPIPR